MAGVGDAQVVSGPAGPCNDGSGVVAVVDPELTTVKLGDAVFDSIQVRRPDTLFVDGALIAQKGFAPSVIA